jgi:hypothetical protein
MNMRSLIPVGVVLLASAVLAACSGGPAPDPVPAGPASSNLPPASASASTQGLVAYTATLAASADDTAQAIDLSRYTLPTDGVDTAVAIATPNDGRGQ